MYLSMSAARIIVDSAAMRRSASGSMKSTTSTGSVGAGSVALPASASAARAGVSRHMHMRVLISFFMCVSSTYFSISKTRPGRHKLPALPLFFVAHCEHIVAGIKAARAESKRAHLE